jgi:hypothetical protein
MVLGDETEPYNYSQVMGRQMARTKRIWLKATVASCLSTPLSTGKGLIVAGSSDDSTCRRLSLSLGWIPLPERCNIVRTEEYHDQEAPKAWQQHGAAH